MNNIEQLASELKRANNWGVENVLPYISVYKAIDQYVVPFDQEKVAKKVAEKDNRTVEEVLNEWEFSRKWGSVKGIVVHNHLSHLYGYEISKGEQDVYDFMSILNGEQLDQFNKHIVSLKKQSEDFYKNNMHLIPIRSEFWVCDPIHGIRGVVDQAMYNQRNNSVEFYDWKTNKNFKFQSYNKWKPEMFLGSLSYMPKTDANYYGLQLNLYKYIVEKYTDIKVNACKIVWFNEHNEKALAIGIPNMQKQIEAILNDRIKLGQ